MNELLLLLQQIKGLMTVIIEGLTVVASIAVGLILLLIILIIIALKKK